VAFLREHGNLIDLARAGIARTIHEPRLVKALVAFDQIGAEDQATSEQIASIAASEAAAAFAQREFDSGFTLLHAHGVVLLWSALETMVVDLCVASLRNVPQLLEADEFRRVRVQFGEFIKLSESERLEALLSTADQSERRQGLARLEGLLQLVGLEGEMDDPSLRRDLHTLHQIRNLVAHRRGIVDRHFLSQCQPVGGVLDERLPIDGLMFTRLEMAAIHYVYVVFNRCCRVYGGTRLVWKFGSDIATPPDAPEAE
jgi:hypothetical protein